MAQIGTIKLQTQNSGTVSVPVYSPGDSGSGVYEMVRVQTASGTGFIPVASTSDASYPYLRVQTQNNGVVAFHDSSKIIYFDDGWEDGDATEYTVDGGSWSVTTSAAFSGTYGYEATGSSHNRISRSSPTFPSEGIRIELDFNVKSSVGDFSFSVGADSNNYHYMKYYPSGTDNPDYAASTSVSGSTVGSASKSPSLSYGKNLSLIWEIDGSGNVSVTVTDGSTNDDLSYSPSSTISSDSAFVRDIHFYYGGYLDNFKISSI